MAFNRNKTKETPEIENPEIETPEVETPEVEVAAKAKSWIIKTPVEDFTGVSRGVAFVEGVGETDNEWFAQRCIDAGYDVKEA